MLVDDGGLAWIFRDDDWVACADTLTAAAYPDEFTLSTYLDADAVEGACLAGFMPMSSRFTVHPGFPYGEPEPSGQAASGGKVETRTFYTPKLHLERCLLDPAEARITTTARRSSKKFRFSRNKVFDQTLAACVRTHGDGWLTPALTKVFTELHADRANRQVKFISIEVWKDKILVAGEIGYAAGITYASLSGFRHLSGAGTVQLTALAGILAESGFSLWDLGMPLDYKLAFGGRLLPRNHYLPLLREAYHQKPDQTLDLIQDPAPVNLPRACTTQKSG